MQRFTIHEDPGHAWLQVTVSDCLAVGLLTTAFSRYSYRDGDDLFLEEDCDLAKFAEAFKAQHGQLPLITPHFTEGDSPIRSYASMY